MRARFPLLVLLCSQILIALAFWLWKDNVYKSVAREAQLAIHLRIQETIDEGAVEVNPTELLAVTGRSFLPESTSGVLANHIAHKAIWDQAQRMRLIMAWFFSVSAFFTAVCLVLVIRLEHRYALMFRQLAK